MTSKVVGGPTLKASLYLQFGHCPAQCDDGTKFHGPSSRVYRSSLRSLTLQCTQCGLQWTMTIHKIAQAAKRLVDRARTDRSRQFAADAAAVWAAWDAGLDVPRGQRMAKATLRKKKRTVA